VHGPVGDRVTASSYTDSVNAFLEARYENLNKMSQLCSEENQ
jgi:hypothetical protein